MFILKKLKMKIKCFNEVYFVLAGRFLLVELSKPP